MKCSVHWENTGRSHDRINMGSEYELDEPQSIHAVFHCFYATQNFDSSD